MSKLDNCYPDNKTHMSKSYRTAEQLAHDWKLLPDCIHYGVCQIKEIPLLAYPEVTQRSPCHTREAACRLILSHNACCLSARLWWFLILRAVVCCCWVMSRPLALSSLEPSEASAGPSVSRQEPRSQSSYEHTKLKMHNFLRFVHKPPHDICFSVFAVSSPTRAVSKSSAAS